MGLVLDADEPLVIEEEHPGVVLIDREPEMRFLFEHFHGWCADVIMEDSLFGLRSHCCDAVGQAGVVERMSAVLAPHLRKNLEFGICQYSSAMSAVLLAEGIFLDRLEIVLFQ